MSANEHDLVPRWLKTRDLNGIAMMFSDLVQDGQAHSALEAELVTSVCEEASLVVHSRVGALNHVHVFLKAEKNATDLAD